jgi:hypothetical protein
MNELNRVIKGLKNKKVAFFHSHILWASHFETDLELIDLLNQDQIEIYNYVCDTALKNCDQNKNVTLSRCASCIKRRKTGLALVDNINEVQIHISKIHFDFRPDLTVPEFLNLKYKNFDVGYAVLSSVIHIYRDPYINIKKHYHYIKHLIETSIGLYEFFINDLQTRKIDHVFLFNGRFVYTKALVRACESLNISFHSHERGSSINKFMLFENSLPHNLQYLNHLMNINWDSPEVPTHTKKKIAEDFFISRKNAQSKDWPSFVEKQKMGLLPDQWNENAHNIGIFLSSEDEFIAVGEFWKRPLFNNQIDGITFILENLKSEHKFHFYIRMHPNSIKAVKFREKIRDFKNSNVTIIEPDSKISSYSLLMAVDKVITFGSTIGIEATFWEKPSINLDNALYYELNATYNPKEIDSILPLIKDINLSAKPKDTTYKYGYYFNSFGYEYTNYKPEGFFSGVFKGVNLNFIEGINFKNLFKNNNVDQLIKLLVKKTGLRGNK